MKKIILALIIGVVLMSCSKDNVTESNNQSGTNLTLNGDTKQFESTNPSLKIEKGITHNAGWQHFDGDMKTIYIRVIDNIGDFLPGFGNYTSGSGKDSDTLLLLKIQINANFKPGKFETFRGTGFDGEILPENKVHLELLYTEWFEADNGYSISIEETNITYIIKFNSLGLSKSFANGTATCSGRLEINK